MRRGSSRSPSASAVAKEKNAEGKGRRRQPVHVEDDERLEQSRFNTGCDSPGRVRADSVSVRLRSRANPGSSTGVARSGVRTEDWGARTKPASDVNDRSSGERVYARETEAERRLGQRAVSCLPSKLLVGDRILLEGCGSVRSLAFWLVEAFKSNVEGTVHRCSYSDGDDDWTREKAAGSRERSHKRKSERIEGEGEREREREKEKERAGEKERETGRKNRARLPRGRSDDGGRRVD